MNLIDALYWGTAFGGIDTLELSYRRLFEEKKPSRPLTIVKVMPNSAAAHISTEFNITGAVYTFSVACASSSVAIGEAFCAIRSGRLDMAMAGGSESMLQSGILNAWCGMNVISSQNSEPLEDGCKPFGRNRTGIVLGEGAAVFVLESEESALRRNADVYGEIIGYGFSSDASGLVQPSKEGQVRAMSSALRDAKISSENIALINAHATGTLFGDEIEYQAIDAVFRDSKPLIFSTKPMHGHLLGAAGAIETASCLAVFQTDIVPKTIGAYPLDDKFLEANINVENSPINLKSKAIMSNSFAFGGANVAMIYRKI